jgi:uncharacterized protein (TIGR03083 family)
VDHERLLTALRHEGSALTAAARAGVAAPVPSCPEWTVHDLLGHLGRIYRRVTEVVRRHSDVEVPYDDLPPVPDDGRVEWFADAHAELVDALANAGADTGCWNWSGTAQTAAFWYRRMAHETAVHRWDAQLAHGTPDPIEPELAVDGVGEAFDVFLPRTLAREPVDGLRGTFLVAATDTGDAWTGEVWPDRAEVRPGTPDAAADATIRGSASDLVLALWGRDVPVERSGDAAILRLLS